MIGDEPGGKPYDRPPLSKFSPNWMVADRPHDSLAETAGYPGQMDSGRGTTGLDRQKHQLVADGGWLTLIANDTGTRARPWVDRERSPYANLYTNMHRNQSY